ncbi:MAG: hypothetical protein LBM96_13050 [Methanobrevibacter sp.]|jgi:hypothetical protein|nr:hypothetical protein [Candidatus Methanoflexus mossambicus]
MINEKKLNVLEFKRKLQENALKKSGAKNLHEYVEYVNNFSAKFKAKKINK